MRGFFTSRLALVNEINALKMRNEGLRAEINSMLEHNARLKQKLNSQRCIKRMRDDKGRFSK